MPTPRAASCLPSSSSDVFAHAGVLPLAASLVPPDASAAADAVALQHELRRLSRRERLRASQSSVLAAAHEYGVSATIHSLVLATLDSFGRNHTLFAPKLVLWSDRTDCSRADLSCFFGSLPSLDETTTLTAPRGAAATTPRVAVDGVRPSLWRHFIGLWFGAGSAHAVPTEQPAALGSLEKLAAAMRTRMQATRHRSANACRKAGGGCPRVLPAHFAASADEAAILGRLPRRYTRHGRFWLLAQTLHFLTRPNAALRHQLQRERTALRLRAHQPALALHVRKGDACSHRGECRGLAEFMPEVRSVAQRYGIRTVFLATPSAEVRAETARYPEFTWLFRNESGVGGGGTERALRAGGHIRLEDGLLSRRVRAVDEWRSAMIDIYLMAECRAFVGAFSSSAARLVLALMAAGAGGCLKPFVSVDIAWCFAFLRGGPEVIRRGGPVQQEGGGDKGISRIERETRGGEAAKRVTASGMTC